MDYHDIYNTDNTIFEQAFIYVDYLSPHMNHLCVFNQMLEQLVQVIGRLLGIASLFFGLKVDKCGTEAIRIPSGPF